MWMYLNAHDQLDAHPPMSDVLGDNNEQAQ